MKDTQSLFSVRLNEANLSAKAPKGYINGTGSIIDDVAYALGLWTWEDVDMHNDVYFSDIVDEIIKRFDWDAYTRDLLNEGISWGEAEKMLVQITDAEKAAALCAESDSSEYLLGDYLEIEENTLWLDIVDSVREKATDSIQEVHPFNRDADAPQSLKNELEKAIDSAYDALRHEWLYGDRSTHGVLDLISKHFTGETGNVSATNDEMTISFTNDHAVEWLGYDYDDAKTISSDEFQDRVIRELLTLYTVRDQKKNHQIERNREKQAERIAAENERLEAKKAAARDRKKSKKNPK